MEGNLYFQIDWASLIVGSKFIVFAYCFSLYLRAAFQVQSPGQGGAGGGRNYVYRIHSNINL